MSPPPVDASLPSAVGDLQRQAAGVAELAQRLAAAAALLPTADAGAAWWGPTREAVQVALDTERERLRREALRAEGVVDQLRVRLAAESGLLPPGFP